MRQRLDKDKNDYGVNDGETAGNPEWACSSLDGVGSTEICTAFKFEYRPSSQIPT